MGRGFSLSGDSVAHERSFVRIGGFFVGGVRRGECWDWTNGRGRGSFLVGSSRVGKGIVWNSEGIWGDLAYVCEMGLLRLRCDTIKQKGKREK